MSEQKVQTQIKKYLEKLGYKVIKLIQLSENGYPDLMALKNGKSIFIEVKAKGKKPRELQLHRIEQLNNIGFKAFWADSLDMVIETIKVTA